MSFVTLAVEVWLTFIHPSLIVVGGPSKATVRVVSTLSWCSPSASLSYSVTLSLFLWCPCCQQLPKFGRRTWRWGSLVRWVLLEVSFISSSQGSQSFTTSSDWPMSTFRYLWTKVLITPDVKLEFFGVTTDRPNEVERPVFPQIFLSGAL